MRPIRGVLSFAVDEQHMRLAPPALTEQRPPEPVEFCVIKRSVIGMYSLRDRLSLQRVRMFSSSSLKTTNISLGNTECSRSAIRPQNRTIFVRRRR